MSIEEHTERRGCYGRYNLFSLAEMMKCIDALDI